MKIQIRVKNDENIQEDWLIDVKGSKGKAIFEAICEAMNDLGVIVKRVGKFTKI